MPHILCEKYLLTNNSRTVSFSPVICVILVFGIVAALVVSGFFVMGQIANASMDGTDLIVQLSGNDISVTILGGKDTTTISSLCVYIEGTPENDRNGIVRNPPVGKPIIYKDLARGRTGAAFVISEATFSDGTKKIVDYSRVQFA